MEDVISNDPEFREALDKNKMTVAHFKDIAICCMYTFEEGKWRHFIEEKLHDKTLKRQVKKLESEWWKAFIKFIQSKLIEEAKDESGGYGPSGRRLSIREELEKEK